MFRKRSSVIIIFKKLLHVILFFFLIRQYPLFWPVCTLLEAGDHWFHISIAWHRTLQTKVFQQTFVDVSCTCTWESTGTREDDSQQSWKIQAQIKQASLSPYCDTEERLAFHSPQGAGAPAAEGYVNERELTSSGDFRDKTTTVTKRDHWAGSPSKPTACYPHVLCRAFALPSWEDSGSP